MNIVCFGAHPDDGDIFAGGTCIKWAAQGHRVLVMSLTNGDKGHHKLGGAELAAMRRSEVEEAARRGGYDCAVLDIPDGELVPSLALRETIVARLRKFEADIVLCHRPNDYHPDHRYAGLAVQDAAYMVIVPKFCPDVPALRKNPVFLYLWDEFKKPYAFQPDVVVEVDSVMARKWQLLDAMESQMYEWLPWVDGVLDSVPSEPDERRQWLRTTWTAFLKRPAASSQEAIKRWYGETQAAGIQFVEAFEICEYGRQPSEEELRELFPF
jgi:LmbE family N-acetylglucosaminyl deacetylase